MSLRDEKQRRGALAEAGEMVREPNFDTTPGADPWNDVLSELNELVMHVVSSKRQNIQKVPKFFPEAAALTEAGSMLRQRARASRPQKQGRSHSSPWYTDFPSSSNGLLLPAYCKFCSVDELASYPIADPEGGRSAR